MNAVDDKLPYSYRTDPDVPLFEDSSPIVFMDGECALCSRGARLIARFDKAGEFRICPVQSPTGKAVLRHFGLNPSEPDSWLYLVDGRPFTSLDAIMRVGNRIGGAGRLLQVFRFLPRGAQDWLYGKLARSRYRLFGKTDMCALPDPELRARLMH
ncbi:thiol-disulfide oxidoreductase DCC family protein [Nitratireductor thuwali]|uniref:DUF393 domain-containing protein n=1 Tax=Nitratireductor thuwali TaxID=2267699 RepID=A0ABY5MJK3_9HYPH|nr:hypothetical protein NTH_00501 [Nitratireductor thuwali]